MKTTQKLLIAAIAASLSSVALAGGDMDDQRSAATSYGENQKGALYDQQNKSASGSSAAIDKPSFSALDTNNDGYVSEDEAKSEADSERLTEKWDTLDTNHDGRLDESEFARFEPVDPADQNSGSASDMQNQKSQRGDSADQGAQYDTDVEVPAGDEAY
ncbi:MAG: hypothetical protein KDI01_05195 [Halioglobus sp.]|nr:hypothetical protein [Halioglobus sp.]